MSKEIHNSNIPYILNGEFYEIIALDGENVTVRCCNCKTRNIYKGSIRSTGNFHMHIKRKHPLLLPRVQEVKLNSLLTRKMIRISRKNNEAMPTKNNSNNVAESVLSDDDFASVFKIEENQKSTSKSNSQSIPWDKITCRLEKSLKGIEEQLQIKNDIERHKLILELAKFQYLNPHFSFGPSLRDETH